MSLSRARVGRRRIMVIAAMGMISVALGSPLTAAAGGSASSVSVAVAKDDAKVIVTFKARPGKAAKASVKAAGGTVTHELDMIKGLSVTMPAAAVPGLRKNPLVESIETDHALTAFADPTGDPEYDAAWGVDQIGTYPVHQAGIKGAGIRLAVIDTGLDYVHTMPPSVFPEFTTNYKGGYDFFNNDANPMDDHGHGTHVTGTIAAEHNGHHVVGVAPEVDLYALKVLGADGSGDYSGLIAALGWAVDNQIDVVNISLGGHEASAALQSAVTAAYNAGVTIVAASGNVVTITDMIYGCPVAYPAAYDEAIAVSFTGTADKLTGYSCTGTQVDLAAPGDAIVSTVPVGTCVFCSPSGVAAQSGTSMASPHVAGAVALVLSHGIADANGNGLLADDVKAHLCATAATASYPPTTDARYPDWYGCGIVDAENALITVPPPGGGTGNHRPVAVADSASMNEDGGSLTIDVLGNDSDQDVGTTLTITASSDPAKGTATVATGGTSVTYVPDSNTNGTDTFDYTVSDGSGGSASATVTVTIAPVNDPPVAVDESATTARNTPINIKVLANDSDIDGDTLTTAALTSPNHGTASIETDGSVTYTPTTGYSGLDAFDYTVSDGAGETAAGHVSISVLAADPPVASDDSLTVDEDDVGIVAVLANDTDPDGGALTTSTIATQPAHGTASIVSDGRIAYTPAPNFNGADSFSYEVADGAGLKDTGVVSVTVNPVNDAPTAVNDPASTAEDTAVTIAVLANDADIDLDELAVTVTSPGQGIAIAGADGKVTYTPPADYNGGDSFGYTVSDGNGGTATASVSISVSAVNDAPSAASKSIATGYAKAVAITMTGADIDSCELTFQIVSRPAHGTLGAVSNSRCVNLSPPNADTDSAKVTYTPAAGYSGADSFTYRTSDGTATSPTVSVSITIGEPIPVHVGDLDGARTIGLNSWTARVTIFVHGVGEVPASGVTVSGTWSNGATGSGTCKTAATTGLCYMTKTGIPNTTTSVTFTVTNLTLTSGIYMLALNHDPDTDSSGTVMVVQRK